MTPLIRVLIADDHPVVRKGLAAFLVPRNGVEVVGEAADGREAVDQARALQPDVILMDMLMPEMNGAEATRLITSQTPKARVLILTSFGDSDILAETLSAGALGYLLKDSQPDDLLQAIRSVYRGQLTIPQNLARKMLSGAVEAEPAEAVLTTREQEVVEAVAEGLSNREIAERLDIGVNTVRTHVSSILRKLDLTNRTQLAIHVRDQEAQND